MALNGEKQARFSGSEDALHEAAMEAVGYDDFGDPSYLEGLRVLLEAYDTEARFTPAGREAARQELIRLLGKRLRAERMWKENPSALDTEIRRPIVITGLVRTGSTTLHHLIGQDPGIQVLEYWLAANPQPRPPRAEWEQHADFQAAVAELDAMYQADPSLKAIHMMMADGPEECRHFLAQHFTDDYFEVNATIPTYTKWYEAKNLKQTYLRHRDLLKLVGATDEGRRWVLKYPVHLKNLGALFEVYPDACIVQTHRDPRQVMSSYVSLIAGFRALFEHDIDRQAVAREQLEVWASGAQHAIEVRRRHDPAQFFDLHFADLTADPIGSVTRIYGQFGLELSDVAERRLAAWRENRSKAEQGKHEHSIDEAGITDAEVVDRFAGYMDYFGLSRGRAG